MSQFHPYHLVNPSPWPIVGAYSVFITMIGAVMYFHRYALGETLFLIGLSLILLTMYVWWRDVIREGTYQGHHTLIVQNGLRVGFILFIVSEVMIFFAFFWAFFHAALAPAIEIGSVWPPVGITPLNAFEVPLLNTALLLSSGATVTWSHHAMTNGNRRDAILGLVLTIILGVAFTALQALEYYEAPFTFADSVYGTTFFSLTGLHGFHVIVGTSFLSVMLVRIIKHHFTKFHMVGYEASLLYWHFVDIVWIILFILVYWWGAA